MLRRRRKAPQADQTGETPPVQGSGRPPSWAFDPPDDYDMPAEVDATVRTIRRVAIGHMAVFFGVVILVPFLTLALDWWSEGRLLGGMSPNFVMAAFGLYVFFFALSIAAARLSHAVEERMLGGGPAARDLPERDGDQP